MSKLALWMSEPSASYAEIAFGHGFRTLVLDVEHGTFDLNNLADFLGFTKARGFYTLIKVLEPKAAAVQQALDFGADGVIIPHLLDLEHAREVTAAAKYPSLGSRSYTSSWATSFRRLTQSGLEEKNRATCCYAMIETAESLQDVEKIAALPTVDGLFPGPTDLSLSCGRGQYTFSPADQADLERCIAAAQAVNKPWIMSGWSAAEREFGVRNDAEIIIAVAQYASIHSGLESSLKTLSGEGIGV